MCDVIMSGIFQIFPFCWVYLSLLTTEVSLEDMLAIRRMIVLVHRLTVQLNVTKAGQLQDPIGEKPKKHHERDPAGINEMNED